MVYMHPAITSKEVLVGKTVLDIVVDGYNTDFSPLYKRLREMVQLFDIDYPVYCGVNHTDNRKVNIVVVTVPSELAMIFILSFECLRVQTYDS